MPFSMSPATIIGMLVDLSSNTAAAANINRTERICILIFETATRGINNTPAIPSSVGTDARYQAFTESEP